MVVHSIILLPGDKMRYFCKDGLSPLDVNNVGQILNFGGDIEAVDCGASNEYATLAQANGDMYDLLKDSLGKNQDIKTASQQNQINQLKFMLSDVYRNWIAGKTDSQSIEMRFQAQAQHYCGQEYTGQEVHQILDDQIIFKTYYCPEAIDMENHYLHPWRTI